MGQDIKLTKQQVTATINTTQKWSPTVIDQNMSNILLLRLMVSSTRNPRDCSRVPNSEMREG